MIKSYITLKEIMMLKSFENSSVLTKKENLEIPVSKINIMYDLDLLDCISKDEILIVESTVFKNIFQNYQKNFIRIMKEKGVNTILLKEGFNLIGDELIDYANTIGFNIIELDKNICFFELIEHVLDKILGENEAFQKSLEEIHLAMNRIILTGGSINSLIAYLKSKFHNIIVLKNNFSNNIVNKRVKTQVLDFIKTYEDHSNSEYIKSFTVNGINIYIIPIIAENTIYGNLFITDELQHVKKNDLLILESVSSMLGLEILKRYSEERHTNVYKLDFFHNIVSNDINKRRKAIESAKTYNLRHYDNYFCMKIDILSGSRCVLIDRILRTLEKLSKEKYASFFVEKEYAIYALIGHYEDYKEAVLFIEQILNNMGYKYFIGIGKEVSGLDEIYNSYQSVETVFCAKRVFKEKDILFYDELGYYKFLGNLSLKDDLLQYAISILKDLIEYDAEKDANLLETLTVYLKCNCNLRKTGAALYTHYNTVLYRVSRIENILNLNLSNENDRLEVSTALKIMDLYQY